MAQEPSIGSSLLIFHCFVVTQRGISAMPAPQELKSKAAPPSRLSRALSKALANQQLSTTGSRTDVAPASEAPENMSSHNSVKGTVHRFSNGSQSAHQELKSKAAPPSRISRTLSKALANQRQKVVLMGETSAAPSTAD